MLVAASAMSPASGAPGAGVPGPPAWVGGGGGACPLPPAGTSGTTAVGGSPLPPDISAVFASGVAGASSPGSLTCGAYTVCGSGTERSSPASAVVSVPAHGVPSSAPPPAAGHAGPPPSEAEAAAPEPAAPEPAGEPSESPVPAPRPAPEDDDAQLASGAPACPGTAPDAAPDPADAPEAASPAPPDVSPRRSGMPSRSAASCSHSGGLSRNDVWLRSTRAGGAGAGS